MNATAVRLPDQFSPGAAAASAATPTCCCCCCCCAVSSVGAAVHLPEALRQDTKDLPKPRSLMVLPAAIFPLLLVVLPFLTLGAVFDVHWGWWMAIAGAALAWAAVAGFVAKSPTPWRSLLRLLGWIVLWCLEPFFALFVLGPIAAVHDVAAAVVVALYLGGALACGFGIFTHYRGKR